MRGAIWRPSHLRGRDLVQAGTGFNCLETTARTTLSTVAILICDVGPRDGLQNEDRTLDPLVRAELCDRLAAAGLKRIEAASFVSPKLVPQMAGAEEVMAALHRAPGTSYAMRLRETP